jgi:hypothetical protein
MAMDDDVRTIERGAQVTFECHGAEAIGSIGDYLGDGRYIVTDMDDDEEYELHEDDLTVSD